MARNELAYAAKAWKDFQSGGTRVNAEDLNNMEAGIADATAAINAVNATVLTYLVAEAGDTATTDLNGAAITGPCYVEDLSNGNRWLDKGDGTARVRTGVSVKEYEALRDSVSQRKVGITATGANIAHAYLTAGVAVLFLYFDGTAEAEWQTIATGAPSPVSQDWFFVTGANAGMAKVGVYRNGDVRIRSFGGSVRGQFDIAVAYPFAV